MIFYLPSAAPVVLKLFVGLLKELEPIPDAPGVLLNSFMKQTKLERE